MAKGKAKGLYSQSEEDEHDKQGWQFPGGKYWEIRIWIPGNKNLDHFGGKYGYIYHIISITLCTDCSIMCAG